MKLVAVLSTSVLELEAVVVVAGNVTVPVNVADPNVASPVNDVVSPNTAVLLNVAALPNEVMLSKSEVPSTWKFAPAIFTLGLPLDRVTVR
jgi:hypothetical protein